MLKTCNVYAFLEAPRAKPCSFVNVFKANPEKNLQFSCIFQGFCRLRAILAMPLHSLKLQALFLIFLTMVGHLPLLVGYLLHAWILFAFLMVTCKIYVENLQRLHMFLMSPESKPVDGEASVASEAPLHALISTLPKMIYSLEYASKLFRLLN